MRSKVAAGGHKEVVGEIADDIFLEVFAHPSSIDDVLYSPDAEGQGLAQVAKNNVDTRIPPDPARWRALHAFASVFPQAGMPFADWHACLTDAALGDSAALDRRLSELQALIEAGRHSAGETVLRFTRAVRAFSRQDFATAIDEIETMLPELVRIGGSRAQLDLVEATLLKACIAADRPDDARRVLARRRPGAMPLAVAA